MITSQTAQIALGAAVAVLYAVAVGAIGTSLVTAFIDRQAKTSIRDRIGMVGFIWLGFVMGQGVLSVVWLALSLAGALYSWLVGILFTLGLILALLKGFALRGERRPGAMRTLFSSFLNAPRWYSFVAISIVALVLLHGLIALLPTDACDALNFYLITPKMVATTHTLGLQPTAIRLYGVHPLQVEMHWAALFTISNETAVTVWDYLCGLSYLSGIGLVAWHLTSSRRVALLAVLMMLTTPAFYIVLGGGRPDNTAAQYSIAAFLWLTLWPALGRRAILATGLCAGWALASRNTNIILIPALLAFAVMIIVHHADKVSEFFAMLKQSKRDWIISIVLGGIAAGVAVAPLWIKNWIIAGAPLAPQFGNQEALWAAGYRYVTTIIGKATASDFFLYPFVWTFADRSMLGNISPLFLGFLPFLLAYRRSRKVKAGLIAGVAGLVAVATFVLLAPWALAHPRWILMSFGMMAIPLSAAIVFGELDLRQGFAIRWMVRSGIILVILFSLLESRAAVYGLRYLAAIDTPAKRYQSSYFNFDITQWLNTHVQPKDRVVLGDYRMNRYLLSPTILSSSETMEELQWLREHGSVIPAHINWTADIWRFYVDKEFTYVILEKERVDEALSTWPSDLAGARLQVACQGQKSIVMRIAREMEYGLKDK